jgi:hypothetical protein
VERVVSRNGSLQVAGQKIQVDVVHAQLVTVAFDEQAVTVDDHDTPIAPVPRRRLAGGCGVHPQAP